MTEPATAPNLNGLVELGNRDGVDIRPTLLRVMTDLYIQKPKHTEAEDKQFTELSLRLIELVDPQTRAIIAAKIAGYPTAPAAVRQRLLREHITVHTLPEAPPVASIPEPATGAKSVADELSELFFSADAEERRLILLNLPYAALAPAKPVEASAARESIHRLETAALGHNNENFARELEHILAISRAQARRLIEDESGEPIVVAAVALAMPAAVLQRVLLCLNPAISQSVQRVYDLAVLHEEIELDAALRLLAIWQASHRAEKKSAGPQPIAHQPVHAHVQPRERPEVPARPKVRWDDLAQTRKESA